MPKEMVFRYLWYLNDWHGLAGFAFSHIEEEFIKLTEKLAEFDIQYGTKEGKCST